MDKPEQTASHSYTGRVQNGIIVLDTPNCLAEGQAVRIEPLSAAPMELDPCSRVGRLKQLFSKWTAEDSELPDEEADRLRVALEQNRGVRFQSPNSMD
jgi:hypothetical protein